MVVTYTTATKVKRRFEDFDTTLTDAMIEEFINSAESIIDCTMRKSARGAKPDFTFDAAKHEIIEDAASNLAAFYCLAAQPTGQSTGISPARAALMGDFFWAAANRDLKMIADERVVSYLAGL